MQIAGSDKMQIIKFISLKEMLTYMGSRSYGRNFVIEKEMVYEFNKSFSSNFQTIKLFCMLRNYTFLCELFYDNIPVYQIIFRH